MMRKVVVTNLMMKVNDDVDEDDKVGGDEVNDDEEHTPTHSNNS